MQYVSWNAAWSEPSVETLANGGSVVMGIALMTSSSSHSFEMEVARREVKRCEDVHHMRELCLSMIDLLEGQRDFLLDSILSERRL